MTWSVVPSVVIKAGVRATKQKIQGSGGEFSLPWEDGASGLRVPGSTDFTSREYTFQTEYAPRVGVSWDITNDGRSKLYANYGRFFERVPNDLAVRALSTEIGTSVYRFNGLGARNVTRSTIPSRTRTARSSSRGSTRAPWWMVRACPTRTSTSSATPTRSARTSPSRSGGSTASRGARWKTSSTRRTSRSRTSTTGRRTAIRSIRSAARRPTRSAPRSLRRASVPTTWPTPARTRPRPRLLKRAHVQGSR